MVEIHSSGEPCISASSSLSREEVEVEVDERVVEGLNAILINGCDLVWFCTFSELVGS